MDCVYEEDSTPQWTRVVQQPNPPADTSPRPRDSTIHVEHDATSQDENTIANHSDSPTHVTMSIETPTHTASTRPPTTANVLPAAPLRRSVSVRTTTAEEGPDSLSWLFRPQLPNRQKVRILAKEYFENVHPLRCYAFIHRPSFIQRLDESSSEDHARNALLHIVCALGAK